MDISREIRLRQAQQSRYILESKASFKPPPGIEEVTNLPSLFRWQATHRGHATLFSFRARPTDELSRVSYKDALNTASQLAQALRGLLPKTPAINPVVGIWFEKSIEIHLAILATTISCSTWLPFDADAPASRVQVCLVDSHARVLLCDSVHYDAAIEATRGLTDCLVVTFDDLVRLSQDSQNVVHTIPNPDARSVAYMIYTSGSTGTPKGIEIPHCAALAFCLSEQSVLGLSSKDVVWQGFSAAFDMFIEEVWISIAGGAHLAVGSRAECQDVPSLGGHSGIWANRGVTILHAVPTLMNIMISVDEDFVLPSCIRLLNLGGEACPPSLVNRLWRPNMRFLNTYGPTETTVTATFGDVLPGQEVTIGTPLPLYHALLLPIRDDDELPLAPLELQGGTEGELAIGGSCLGNGYVGRPTLTTAKFIEHPIPLHPGERLYRTGDRVRLDGNGNIVFLGRIDMQIKHRGFRIELGEIESALAVHEHVQTAVVILSAKTDRLEAYIVATSAMILNLSDLRANLRGLPAYMHPEAYHFITSEQLPRLASGKVNAKGLQDLSASLALLVPAQVGEKGPGSSIASTLYDDSELGQLLSGMAEIFPQASPTSTSDFFEDLGGHSMSAAMLVSKVRQSSSKDSVLRRIALQDVYMLRTAEKIIEKLMQDSKSLPGANVPEKTNVRRAEYEDHWPVSRRRYILCGIAQIPPLFLLFFIEGISTLGPYIIFNVFLEFGIGYAVLSSYVAFLLVPLGKALIGIIGKWMSIGVAKAGEYPLYGVYYYRWWLAERFVELIDLSVISETPLVPSLMRCLGATVGSFCHLHVETPSIGAAFDLVHIGDDVLLGRDSTLCTSTVERGRLILAPIWIGCGASVGTQTVLEGNTVIEDGGEIGPSAMLPFGRTIPAGERWIGCPARFHSYPSDVGHMKASRPSRVRVLLNVMATFIVSVFIMPVLYFLPQIPSILLFEYVVIPGVWIWAQTAAVAVPATLVYFSLVFLELFILRWLVLGRVKECSYRLISFYSFRKWFVARMMDMSLLVLHPVYATLYTVPFLRSLGVNIGRRAEVSTGRGIDFELTEIGDEAFLADNVYMGDRTMRANTVTQRKTTLQARAFAGNSSLIPQGTVLPSNCLVGVLSVAPEVPLNKGQSCFGNPPVLMPVREAPKQLYPDHLLYAPRWTQVMMRLFIEGMRIILPRLILVFGLGFGVQIFFLGERRMGARAVLLLPVAYFSLFAIPALSFTLLCKWVLIGRYKAAEWPLWSVHVWKSEFVTATYETLVAPLLTKMLVGTPYLAWTMRLFGVQIGARATILTTDITEYDVVSVGDEAVLDREASPQTHLFEDRIMKIGRIGIEARGCMKANAHALPDSGIGVGGMLGSASLLMKGETVPAGEKWEGNPIIFVT